MSGGYLGELVWWSIGHPDLSPDEVAQILVELDVRGAPAPNAVIPIDAFRRLTGGQRMDYELGDVTVTLDLHRAESQKSMLVRHIVRTVSQEGVIKDATRVGECAFHRPPKGQPFRGRIRVTAYPDDLPDRAEIEKFAQSLRTEYGRALNYLDPQALRRMLRQYLQHVHALYLAGPYFVPQAEDADRLVTLVSRLGGGSSCHTVPVLDDEKRRAMLTTGLEIAASRGEVSSAMIETYAPLGVVPDALSA